MGRGRSERAVRGDGGRGAGTGKPLRAIGRSLAFIGWLLHGRVRYLAFLLAVTAGIGAITVGSIFRVRQVQVYGTLLLDRSAVVNAASLVGANPFLVSTSAAEKRVLALGVPEHVSVSFSLPDTAIVDVVEHTPAYIWKVDPTMYLVAADGTVLGTTLRENERVIVVDSDHRPVKVGEKVDVRPLQEAGYLMSVLPSLANLSPHYLFYSRNLGIVVPAADGTQIAFGDDRDLRLKLQALGPTLEVAFAQKPRPKLIDLQFPHHPFFH